ncbi:MAG: alanine racemase [Ectothiorhodospiraceae bacterium]|nr:alanine racemase [Ectothiorhodospiraceae bacterium]MCH8506322.1 alanine racemase [Ectothiorhodospiraceae bacterium]
MSRDTRAVISAGALRHNLQVARHAARGARVMAVIKSNGYGHGLLRVARALSDADAFAVTCLEEAVPLREAGYVHPILLLEGVFEPRELEIACRYRLDLVLHSEWQLELLESHRLSRSLSVWLKVDSGMHRLGFPPELVAQVHQRLLNTASVGPHIRYMTHLACADDRNDRRSLQQLERFSAAVDVLRGERSLVNSAGLLGWPDLVADWARPGIMLYGASPFIDGQEPKPDLRPAMTLCSRLIAINQVRKGETVGYGATWTCPEDMPVGVVTIGYGDGYPRHAPSGTPVLVNGLETQLIGRVSMDMITVDLRGIRDQVSIGDPVTLWGDGLPIERVAEKAGTIAYELLCGVTRRVYFEEARDSHHGPGPYPV